MSDAKMPVRAVNRTVYFGEEDPKTIEYRGLNDLRRQENAIQVYFSQDLAQFAGVLGVQTEFVVQHLAILLAIHQVATLTHVSEESLRIKEGSVREDHFSIETIPPWKFAVSS